MGEIIKAKSDIFFRYLFGVQEHEECRVDFINAVLQDDSIFDSKDNPLIVSTKVINPFILAEYQEGKEPILDIKALDNLGRTINIEMQLQGNSGFSNRTLYYWSKQYSEQLTEGEKYNQLNPVICINLIDFLINKTFNEVHLCSHIYFDQHKDTVLTNHFEIHFLQLPKLEEKPDFQKKINVWMEYFKKAQEGINMDYVATINPAVKTANSLFNEFTSDKQSRMIYENHMKIIRDRNTMLDDARSEGLVQGRTEGLVQGRTEGLVQGRTEGARDAKIETARKMRKYGDSTEKISLITGLSIEEINNLKE